MNSSALFWSSPPSIAAWKNNVSLYNRKTATLLRVPRFFHDYFFLNKISPAAAVHKANTVNNVSAIRFISVTFSRTAYYSTNKPLALNV